MDGISSISIPVKGGKSYKSRVKSVSAACGITMAEAVRHALDLAYGKDLERMPLFFGNGVGKSGQLSTEDIIVQPEEGKLPEDAQS